MGRTRSYWSQLLRKSICKIDLNNEKGACDDWTKAAEMGVENAAEALEEHCKNG